LGGKRSNGHAPRLAKGQGGLWVYINKDALNDSAVRPKLGEQLSHLRVELRQSLGLASRGYWTNDPACKVDGLACGTGGSGFNQPKAGSAQARVNTKQPHA